MDHRFSTTSPGSSEDDDLSSWVERQTLRLLGSLLLRAVRQRQIHEWQDQLECTRATDGNPRRELFQVIRSSPSIAWTAVPSPLRISLPPLATAMLATLLLWPAKHPPPDQSTSVPTFVLPSGSVTLDRRPRSEVGQCWLVKGRARLKAGKTLLIAARRISPPDPRTYYAEATWAGQPGRSAWGTARFFGTESGQSYRVSVVAVETNEARGVEDSGKLPPDAEVQRLGPDVRQTSHVTDC
jgi:hypothetical protein